MSVYLKHAFEKKLKPAAPVKTAKMAEAVEVSGVDHTAKMYIGGKQVRGDSGYSRMVLTPAGEAINEVCDGNRKDIRNAVEAARGAMDSWAAKSGHNRAQILYFLGENLDYRKKEFADRIREMTGVSAAAAKKEVDLSIERLFAFAGWADKYDGMVHNVPQRAVSMAMVEPMGVIGMAAPNEMPLLGSLSMLAPAVAMGNAVVLVPSELHPLSLTDLYQVIETSDVPGGVINVVTGDNPALAQVLAEHDGVDAIWFAGDQHWSSVIEKASIGNLKRTWTARGRAFDWADNKVFNGNYFLEQATQIKNIWVPYGA